MNLSGSLLSAIPAHAATTSKIDSGAISKPSSIKVMAISTNQPPSSFSGGTLWCTGDGVYVRDYQGNKIPDGYGGYVTMDRGDSEYFEGITSDGRAYFQSWDGTMAYVSKTYLSTVMVY
jgi:hypothetical protein